MCKNLFIAGVKPEKQDELNAFMFAMAPIMTAHDDDGLGYAAMTEKGIMIERWFDPKDAFRRRKIWTHKDNEIQKEFKGLLQGSASYNVMCETKEALSAPKMAVIMHARMATCERALKNVHPFYRDGVALVHNGVISNTKDLKQITSTCDSECILNSYVDNKVAHEPKGIEKVGMDLRGSYACGVLTKDKDGKPIMDIFRSSPNLTAIFIKELDALVFCTVEGMVEAAVKSLKWSMSNGFKVKDDKLIRLDARTGRFLLHEDFRSNSYYYQGNSSPYAGRGYMDGYEGWIGYEDDAAPSNKPAAVAGSSSNSGTVPTVTKAEDLGRTGDATAEKKSSSGSHHSPKILELTKIRTLGETTTTNESKAGDTKKAGNE